MFPRWRLPRVTKAAFWSTSIIHIFSQSWLVRNETIALSMIFRIYQLYTYIIELSKYYILWVRQYHKTFFLHQESLKINKILSTRDTKLIKCFLVLPSSDCSLLVDFVSMINVVDILTFGLLGLFNISPLMWQLPKLEKRKTRICLDITYQNCFEMRYLLA